VPWTAHVLAAGGLAACGARSGLPVPAEVDAGKDDAAADARADAPAPVDAARDTGPDAPPDAPACVGSTVPILPNVPNLYFVLDRSASMATDSKWTNVRTAVANLIFDLGTSAQFGAAVFPAPQGMDCATGVEVMSLRRGDLLGQVQTAFLNATNFPPNGGTPTSATLQALVPRLGNLPLKTFVILATDGGPNCNANRMPPTCDVSQCTRNVDRAQGCDLTTNCCSAAMGGATGCLDDTATELAVRDLFDMGVETYVMGIPGSAPYGPVLDALAVAGGTARASEPRYYQVSSPDTGALAQAFSQIAAQIMKSCSLELQQAPANPAELNVFINGRVVPSDGPDGWSLDGQTVTMRGATCAALMQNAGMPTFSVTQGCPTVR
jgi:hypothetical protein